MFKVASRSEPGRIAADPSAIARRAKAEGVISTNTIGRTKCAILPHMPNYRRVIVPGGCCFFTVNLSERRETLLVDHIRYNATAWPLVLRW